MCAQKAKIVSDVPGHGEIIRLLKAQDFDEALPQKNLKPESLAVYVRQLLQNWRQGTVGCKGRSDVSYANRKPWKQKGTGRARAGSARSPLWRGGGVIFGPQARVRTLKVSKQMRRGVLNTLFWQYLNHNKIGVINWSLEHEAPKTSQAYEVLKNAQLLDKKVTLFLSSDDMLHYASFSNIKNVNILFFDHPNAYSVVSSDQWIVFKKDFDAFKQMVNAWV